MNNQTLTVVGVGNMGRAIVAALLERKPRELSHIILYDPHQDLTPFKRQDISIAKELSDAIVQSSTIIIAVKPQAIAKAFADISPHLSKNQVILSIAAGVTIENLHKFTHLNQPIIRVMPNLCAQVRESMSCWVANSYVSSEQQRTVKDILESFGTAIKLPHEDLMNVATAIAGSGPAYVFYLTELLTQNAMRLGIPTEIAPFLARQTIWGAAKTLKMSVKSAQELKDAVTSEGGTTQAALETFYNEGLSKVIAHGITNATNRAKELSKATG